MKQTGEGRENLFQIYPMTSNADKNKGVPKIKGERDFLCSCIFCGRGGVVHNLCIHTIAIAIYVYSMF